MLRVLACSALLFLSVAALSIWVREVWRRR
jgi:hypothetical protein